MCQARLNKHTHIIRSKLFNLELYEDCTGDKIYRIDAGWLRKDEMMAWLEKAIVKLEADE